MIETEGDCFFFSATPANTPHAKFPGETHVKYMDDHDLCDWYAYP